MKNINLAELAEIVNSGKGLGIGGSRFITSVNKQVINKFLNQSAVQNWLRSFDYYISGGAKGVDAYLLRQCYKYGKPCVTIEPSNKRYVDRYLKEYSTHLFVMPNSTDFRERNFMVVNSCHEFLAMPMYEEENEPRSGTWQAVRLARVMGTPICLHLLNNKETFWERRDVPSV
jgi:predicted Rossmann fold nucleotide-binding protein DprA/Smf involved in DNA uptake